LSSAPKGRYWIAQGIALGCSAELWWFNMNLACPATDPGRSVARKRNRGETRFFLGRSGGFRQPRNRAGRIVGVNRPSRTRSTQRKRLLQHMSEGLRLSSLALFALGPVVAGLALLRRRLEPSPTLSRIRGWRWYVPVVLLPVEWLLPPALIALRVGEIEASWLPLRVVGLVVGLAGAALLLWGAALLGRLLIHEAAVREDHALIESGPYRFVRHPVYAGYLALLLGSGVASLNVCLWLIWPVSLLGIVIQAAAEEQLLKERFGPDYECYARRTGRLVPRFWRQSAEPAAPAEVGVRQLVPKANGRQHDC
jgi:protein-S-isoprenylcysteine O-methyltransferase Ste14